MGRKGKMMAAPKGNIVESGVCGIYRIISPSGRVYVGQAIDIKLRFQKYFGGSCPGQRRLHSSFKKYGAMNHRFEVIETCAEEVLLERERYHQERYDVLGKHGLNCKLTATSDRCGKHSEETRLRIATSNTGKKHTLIARAKMRAARLGRKMPEEQRLRMCGRKLPAATVAKMKERMLGNSHTAGLIPKNARPVRDGATGKTYPSTKSAAEALGIRQRTLKAWLTGQTKNRSTMEFA